MPRNLYEVVFRTPGATASQLLRLVADDPTDAIRKAVAKVDDGCYDAYREADILSVTRTVDDVE